MSVVTPPDLDGSEKTLDNAIGGDAGLDLGSNMDMMVSMIMDLSNTVNGQGEGSQLQSATVDLSPAAPCHAVKKTRQQTAPAQDPELEEALCNAGRWSSVSARFPCWRLLLIRRIALVMMSSWSRRKRELSNQVWIAQEPHQSGKGSPGPTR